MRIERWLTWIVRLYGAVLLLALVGLLMPRAWMVEGHRWLEMPGEFPEAPVAEYLARALSGLYAAMGAVFLAASSDVRRHGPVLAAGAAAVAVVALAILAWTPAMGVPLYWTAGDAASAVVGAGVILGLQLRLRAEDRRRAA